MRRNLILPLIIVIGILVFSSVASANLWETLGEKLGLNRMSGANVAWNVGNPTDLKLVISTPKAGKGYYVGDDVWLVARGNKDSGYPTTIKYSVYLDGAAVLSSKEINVRGNSFTLTHKLASNQLPPGEHKIGINVCGWYKEECIGEQIASVYINVKQKETTITTTQKECPAVIQNIAYGDYNLNLGASMNVGGAKITIIQVGTNAATLRVSKA